MLVGRVLLTAFLHTGTIRADFHMLGMAPWFSDVWNIIEKVIERAGKFHLLPLEKVRWKIVWALCGASSCEVIEIPHQSVCELVEFQEEGYLLVLVH